MKKLKDIFLLGKRTLIHPAGATADLSKPGASYTGPLAIYFVCAAAYALLLYVKPAGFPSDLAEAASEFSGRPYAWIFAVQACSELALTAVLCAFFPLFAALMSEGKLFIKLVAGSAICGLYAAASFYFRHSPAIAAPLLAAVSFAAYRSLARSPRTAAAFFRFMLAASAAEFLCLPLSFAAAGLRSEQFLLLASLAPALWILGLTIKAAKALYAGTAVRAAAALLFSAVTAIFSFYILKNLGLIPPEIFRFMMFM